MAATAATVTVAGLAACSSSSSSGQASGPQTITVAVVNNPQMIDIQKLTPKGFTASHPNIKVKYVTLDENTLRDQVTKDVAAGGGPTPPPPRRISCSARLSRTTSPPSARPART